MNARISMNSAERRRRTREALLEAAALEFETQGYAKTTLQGVADRLGLTRGTVLFHFHTKEALRDTLIQWCDERLCAKVSQCSGRSDFARILAAIADMHYEDARIRSGLLLHEEKARAENAGHMKWEEALELVLFGQLNDAHDSIKAGALIDMYIAVIRSDRWKNKQQLRQALDFYLSLTGLSTAADLSDNRL